MWKLFVIFKEYRRLAEEHRWQPGPQEELKLLVETLEGSRDDAIEAARRIAIYFNGESPAGGVVRAIDVTGQRNPYGHHFTARTRGAW